MEPRSDRTFPEEPINGRRLATSGVVTVLVVMFGLFVPAGSLTWWPGWRFLAVVVVAVIVMIVTLRRVNPEIIAARVNRHTGTKPWDRWVLAVFIPTLVAIVPVAALDAGRFQRSPLPWEIVAVGYVLLFLGMAGLTWAEAVNRHFEPTVRIQTDRDHRVVDAGPYTLVRHPGYLSALPFAVGIALALGSYWALIPAAISWLVLVVRTAWEDQTLQQELPGYREYAQRVRYRLLPGLW